MAERPHPSIADGHAERPPAQAGPDAVAARPPRPHRPKPGETREMGRAAVVGCRQHGALVLGERSRLYAGGRACVNSEMCVSCLSRVCVCVCVCAHCVKCCVRLRALRSWKHMCSEENLHVSKVFILNFIRLSCWGSYPSHWLASVIAIWCRQSDLRD